MKKLYYTVILIIITTYTFAQERSIPDTTYTLSEVEILKQSQKRVEIGKIDVPMQYLPISVSTVASKALEIRGITNIEDAVKFLPGVRMNTTYGAFQTLLVRGFDYTPITIDGIRDERTMIGSYPFPDITNIESMELLKGPASVLYGHSVLGGVLNISRKSPTPYNIVNAKLTYGSWNNKQANMDFGGKLAGPVNYRTNFNFAHQDGWRDNGNKRFSGYLALDAQIDKSSKVDIRGSFNRDWYGTEIGLAPNMSNDIYNDNGLLYLATGEMQPDLNRKARYNNESDFFKHHGWNVSGKYEKKFGENMKITEYISYINDDIDYFSTEELSYLTSSNPIYKHYYLNPKGIKTYINLDTVQLTFPLRFSHLAKTLTNQLELSGIFHTASIKHNYLGGYSFTSMNRDSYSGYNIAPDDDPLNSKYDVFGPGLYSKVAVRNPHSMGYMETKFGKVIVSHNYSHGIYFQDLIELSKNFKTLIAARYDIYTYKRGNSKNDAGKLVNTLPAVDGKREYRDSDLVSYNTANNAALTYRAGLVYLPIPSVSIFGSAASYFKPDRTFPAANTIYLNKSANEVDTESDKGIFDPEQGYQIEAGTRYSYKSFNISFSAYYVRKNDVIRNLGRHEVEDGSTKSIVAQLSSEHSKGFDVEVAFHPLAYFNLNAGYSYTKVETRDIKKNKFVDKDSQILTLVPENTFYTYGNVTVPKGFFKNTSVLLSVSFMDKTYRNNAKTMYFPSYWLTDMGVSYPLKNRITLSANVNNMFNKQYYNQAIDYQMVPSMPRNFMLSVSYNLR